MSSAASRAHYARLTSDNGRALRDFFAQALTDHDRLPGKAALQKMAGTLAEQIGADPEKLAAQFVTYARGAQDRSRRFRLRGEIDQLASELVKRIEDSDRLVEAPEAVDAQAVADAAIASQDPQGARAAQAGHVDQGMGRA